MLPGLGLNQRHVILIAITTEPSSFSHLVTTKHRNRRQKIKEVTTRTYGINTTRECKETNYKEMQGLRLSFKLDMKLELELGLKKVSISVNVPCNSNCRFLWCLVRPTRPCYRQIMILIVFFSRFFFAGFV